MQNDLVYLDKSQVLSKTWVYAAKISEVPRDITINGVTTSDKVAIVAISSISKADVELEIPAGANHDAFFDTVVKHLGLLQITTGVACNRMLITGIRVGAEIQQTTTQATGRTFREQVPAVYISLMGTDTEFVITPEQKTEAAAIALIQTIMTNIQKSS